MSNVDTQFKKGQSPWNKDKKLPERSGINHPNWKGRTICPNCSGSKSYTGKLCLPCSTQVNRIGEANPSWNGGKPKCIDCSKITTQYSSVRCLACYRKYQKTLTGEKNHMWGKTLSDEARAKIGSGNKGKHSGPNNPRWIADRTQLKKKNERNDSAYIALVREAKKRDGKCRLFNENCRGYLTVHHILTWKDYPEERYNINNCITLCQGHHPRIRAEEKRLVPVFQKLLTNIY